MSVRRVIERSSRIFNLQQDIRNLIFERDALRKALELIAINSNWQPKGEHKVFDEIYLIAKAALEGKP